MQFNRMLIVPVLWALFGGPAHASNDAHERIQTATTVPITAMVVSVLEMGFDVAGNPYAYDSTAGVMIEPQLICNQDKTVCTWEVAY